jgi:aminoglycoside phosphotransferase (APT) family kinase protein
MSASPRSRAVLADAFQKWFTNWLGRDATVVVNRPQPGLSSDTLILDVTAADATKQYVARLPPLSGGLFPDYDLARQARIQQALTATSIPVAEVLAFEADDTSIGQPFLLMPKVPGRILETQPPYLTHGWLAEASPEEQTALVKRFVELLAEINRLDVAALDLGELSGGGPNLAGVLDYWNSYVDWTGAGVSKTEDEWADVYRSALRWCRDNLPTDVPPAGLIWGDPQLVNLVIAEDQTVEAVLDWEMAGLGPAELDLTWFLVLHEHAVETAGTELPGYPGREQVIEWYAAALGREVADLQWYDVLANIRSGAIVLRIGALMAAAGQSTGWTAHVPQHRWLAGFVETATKATP